MGRRQGAMEGAVFRVFGVFRKGGKNRKIYFSEIRAASAVLFL
jgi:hypothetical protein